MCIFSSLCRSGRGVTLKMCGPENDAVPVALQIQNGCRLDTWQGCAQCDLPAGGGPGKVRVNNAHWLRFSRLNQTRSSHNLSFLSFFVLFCFFKTYPPPELPKDYRPVHYFRPVVAATSENSRLLQVLSESAGKPVPDPGTLSRHQLNASKRGELLGETPVQGRCHEEDDERYVYSNWSYQNQNAKLFSQRHLLGGSVFPHGESKIVYCEWHT